MRVLTIAVAMVILVVAGSLWRRASPPPSPQTARATAPPAPSSSRPSDLDRALAELQGLRRAEGRAYLALLAIERTAKESAAPTGFPAGAATIHGDLLAEAQREYEEARRQRSEFEFMLRAQYGQLPE